MVAKADPGTTKLAKKNGKLKFDVAKAVNQVPRVPTTVAQTTRDVTIA